MGTVDAVNIIAGARSYVSPSFRISSRHGGIESKTQRMGVVIEIHSKTSLRVITGWEK